MCYTWSLEKTSDQPDHGNDNAGVNEATGAARASEKRSKRLRHATASATAKKYQPEMFLVQNQRRKSAKSEKLN